MQSLVPQLPTQLHPHTAIHHLPLHTTATLLIVVTITYITNNPAPTARYTHTTMNPPTTTTPPLPQYIVMDSTTSTAIDMADIEFELELYNVSYDAAIEYSTL